MLEEIGISKIDVYIALIINAVCTGLGSAIGSAITNWNIKRIAKLHKHIKKRGMKGGKQK